MIRLRYFICILLIVMIAFLIYAKPYEATFTDMVHDPNNANYLHVGEMGEARAETQTQLISELIKDAPYIFRIRVTQDTKYRSHTGYLQAKVLQVFAGDDVKVGEDITIASNNWCVTLTSPPKTIERRFVNLPQAGSEYLVFCSEKAMAADESMEAYILFSHEQCTLSCIFGYEDREMIAVTPTSQYGTYVPYIKVINNEFFATSEEAMKILMDFKHSLLEAYPSNGNT